MLINDELLARVGLVGIDQDGTFARLGLASDEDNVARSLGVYVVAGLH